MKLLISQIEFEQMIGRQQLDETMPELPAFSVIYFTAKWCGACKKLDMDAIEAEFPDVNWLKCDVDANNYTPGFCGVKSIPAFMAIGGKKILAGPWGNSSTAAVKEWVRSQRQSYLQSKDKIE